MKRYLKTYLLLVSNSFQTAFASRFGAILFIVGKLIRFAFFLWLLVLVIEKTQTLHGYTLNQVIFFFLTFNLVDITAQMLFREVYRFRPLIVSGDFDLILTKPIHPFARILFGGADPLDAITIVPLVALIVYFAEKFSSLSIASPFLFILLFVNALFIATAFHIAVLALGILTTAVGTIQL